MPDALPALRTLQSRSYSLDAPFQNLGAHLRAYALLIYAIPRRRLPAWSDSRDESMKDALSDLAIILHHVTHAHPNPAGTSLGLLAEDDIIYPISYIICAISHNLDALRVLLPRDFDLKLEAFFSALKRYQLLAERFWITVPWKDGRWYPSDAHTAALELIAKLRRPLDSLDGVSATQYVFHGYVCRIHITQTDLGHIQANGITPASGSVVFARSFPGRSRVVTFEPCFEDLHGPALA